MGSTRVNMPKPPDYKETSRDILRTQLELAPELYANEQKYQPLYQALQDQIQRQSAQAQIQMFQDLQPEFSKLESNYQKSQQESQLQGLQERAPSYIQAFQRASGTLPGIQGMQKYAAELQAMPAQYGLDPQERRAIEQQTRAAYAARGTALGDQSALSEVLNRYQFENQRRIEEDQLRMQRQMAAAGLTGNIAQLASPALTSFYQQPMYASNFAGNTVQSALMGQQQSGPQIFNPESQTGFGLAAGAYNAKVQGAIGQAQANAAKWGALGSATGAIGGAGIIAAACWVAREVYGESNPRWMMFRRWLFTLAPGWFRNLYIKFGERFAKFISNKPALKSFIRSWMDSRIEAL
jgi:hypothetical protein